MGTIKGKQKAVLDLLRAGGQYSTADISKALHFCDPRALIRDLRKKGIPIADVWLRSSGGGRYKRYFIRP